MYFSLHNLVCREELSRSKKEFKDPLATLELLGEYLKDEKPSCVFLPRSFQIFLTASSLNANTKKPDQKKGIFIGDLHPFFKIAQELWEAYEEVIEQFDQAKPVLVVVMERATAGIQMIKNAEFHGMFRCFIVLVPIALIRCSMIAYEKR